MANSMNEQSDLHKYIHAVILHGISHDYKRVVASILDLLDSILKRYSNDQNSKQSEFLDSIERNLTEVEDNLDALSNRYARAQSFEPSVAFNDISREVVFVIDDLVMRIVDFESLTEKELSDLNGL